MYIVGRQIQCDLSIVMNVTFASVDSYPLIKAGDILIALVKLLTNKTMIIPHNTINNNRFVDHRMQQTAFSYFEELPLIGVLPCAPAQTPLESTECFWFIV